MRNAHVVNQLYVRKWCLAILDCLANGQYGTELPVQIGNICTIASTICC